MLNFCTMMMHVILFFILHDFSCFFYFRSKAVAAEKAHNSLISGVEHFDKATMKHAETEEKNPLPPIEGIVLLACLNSL